LSGRYRDYEQDLQRFPGAAMVSRGPIRHREDLEVLPKEYSFVFQDHLPAVSGGLVRYWKDRGLIQRVGTVRKNGQRGEGYGN